MTARLLVGDVRKRIREIPDGSVDLVCTSPPFLALRKYGDNAEEMGSERNPAAFIDALLELTGEFRRVLAPHGSIAIELGDTYSGSGGAGGDYNDDGLRAGQAKFSGSARKRAENGILDGGRPSRAGRDDAWPLAKSLAGVPEAYMLSLAYGWNVLDRDGNDSPAGRWRVRNVIVWARPNPPVGALGDKVRPATSYITVACVSDKRWFDLDSVRDSTARTVHADGASPKQLAGATNAHHNFTEHVRGGAPPLDWWEDDDPTGHATLILPTAPFSGAHFATWPPTLAKRLIEMMCPLRVCVTCGEPSRRIVEATEEYAEHKGTRGFSPTDRRGNDSHLAAALRSGGRGGPTAQYTTLGWSDCGHDNWRKGHTLDPFSGSGTTLSVAQGCGRDATGIELYEANGRLSQERMGFFLEVIS